MSKINTIQIKLEESKYTNDSYKNDENTKCVLLSEEEKDYTMLAEQDRNSKLQLNISNLQTNSMTTAFKDLEKRLQVVEKKLKGQNCP